jgi:hypothetical protein
MEILRLRKDAGYTPPDGPSPGPLTHEQFTSVRRAVIRALVQHGTVEPMDKATAPIGYRRCGDPDYWVVDDWWSDTQKFVSVETEPRCISGEAVESILAVCRQFEGWGVAFTLFGREKRIGYLLCFAHCIMRHGRMFWLCRSVEQVLAACRRRSAPT